MSDDRSLDLPAGHPLRQVGNRQAGILSFAQCRAAGLSAEAIRWRITSGRWRRLHLGVFATFTGPLPRPAVLWAALLYAGDGAMLSHSSAGELVGLVDTPVPAVHVTIPHGRRLRPVAGVVVHRSRRTAGARHPSRLPPQTRVEETVLDLAHAARDLDQALGWLTRACAQRLTTSDRIGRALRSRRRMRWRPELLTALADVATGCHSWLELRYLRKVERPHGLPRGVRQQARTRRGGRWYDDVRYADHATVVELDGCAAHPEASRARDRRRDNAAIVDGLNVLRYGSADVIERPCETAVQIASTLRRHGWTGPVNRCGPSCRVPG
ncbi:type IV toxin-antitoxin system AbiEi family antitoxin domain-containing protein [Plantactinospora sp. KLBMP9567]|uniref:type IV toxin-antitoxin system AbiEi family antitoxin domain-containing protein n=1 Tax=Plantactinospora sp. KLBMP9567 TaxID=3085900 RepID=UPI002980EE42|nr:type IV toxin-antitoxin system AbiEi family antitoxin domain-containing protein [Plantactinospora sp. KLBMP9567]MDW5328967.1 type IV toxin-antitoxin system AbiEi family antitoxin domain-containing protein [Plantactinospora sp. KLBMP9567]